MKVYDMANNLAQEIKQSEEYKAFKQAKQLIDSNEQLRNKIREFEKVSDEAQIIALQTGKDDIEKMKHVQQLYGELIQNAEASKYFDAEIKFNVMVSDVNKIIGESIQDLIK